MAQAPGSGGVMGMVRDFAANLRGPGQQSTGQATGQPAQPKPGDQNVPGSSNDPNKQAQQPTDPMEVYKDIFAAPDPSKATKPPSFDLSGEAINKAAEQLNFSASIPEELRTALEGMGEQGKAIMSVLDHVGRQAYATSMAHMSNLTGKFVDTRSQFDRQGLGQSINEHLALNSVSSLAGEKSNPVVKEGLKIIGKQLSAQYPDATPEWIAQKSREFYMEMAKATSPEAFKQSNATEEAQAPGGLDFNWNEWATSTQTKQ